MASSLKLWIPLALVTGWVLGHGTSVAMNPPLRASEPSPQALKELRARIDSLSAQLTAIQSQMRCTGSTTAAAPDTAPPHAELRQVLREELTTLVGRPEPTNAATPAPAQKELSPTNLAALERGQRLLEDALHSRRWGDAQVEELRRLLPEMTAAQQQMLMQKLSASINRGELVVETTDMPF
ncbi:hypothetical protein [Vitiosangium sp. GDMCC 1.1324]|uniref:hypothetical protein n=1 Tax=Vitiosangium sp. (strain GDMCC 1.1324) TaxID=2138576 RepID=UPI000D3C22A6|nr:hypothetical protein [Vitiosangium sp. GDMCC 1.1324]PTL81997.1 hypothetical protein DAT35_19485 [Vitiosangium sp. GDMCC 1.1324]